MMRPATVVFAALLVSVCCGVANANWYGKRGDKTDFFSLFLQQRLDSLASRDVDAASALTAIDQIIQMWRQHNAESVLATQLKQ
ncbi:hypothetical protein C0Q70_03810 [Pomacea canaliculata]|uniref:Uncharacterized protein n=1 Tax=Pomacea canaliculata TaxID=400727 RepID=A0A2T7PTV8_POMCA|nr:uncharacterized protein LOC112557363 [Pomacea canaliculata]PVD36820.1 hypothetical protein C0Q70_03810 [Pomacea canaliculata]